MYRGARGPVEKDDVAASTVVGIAPDRPEIAGFELALTLAPGLDRGLVHGLDPRAADPLKLSGDDRGEQQRTAEH